MNLSKWGEVKGDKKKLNSSNVLCEMWWVKKRISRAKQGNLLKRFHWKPVDNSLENIIIV